MGIGTQAVISNSHSAVMVRDAYKKPLDIPQYKNIAPLILRIKMTNLIAFSQFCRDFMRITAIILTTMKT